jgi:1-deoxy-D-xylulose-5-phosphate synthase
LDEGFKKLPWGKAELRRQGEDLALIGIGVEVAVCEAAAETLAQEGVQAAVVNARFVKPLDEDLICELAGKCGRVITVEENEASGGFGSAVLEALSRRGLYGVKTRCIAVQDTFVEHGPQAQLRHNYGLDAEAVVKAALEMMG